jgi:ABC-2 type transport system permease protein
MELLITSAKPVSMMFGKVIASCLTGLIQLVCVFGSSFLFFNLNRSYWGENAVINSIFNMPAELLVYMLLFFVLGFFIYAFLFVQSAPLPPRWKISIPRSCRSLCSLSLHFLWS